MAAAANSPRPGVQDWEVGFLGEPGYHVFTGTIEQLEEHLRPAAKKADQLVIEQLIDNLLDMTGPAKQSPYAPVDPEATVAYAPPTRRGRRPLAPLEID